MTVLDQSGASAPTKTTCMCPCDCSCPDARVVGEEPRDASSPPMGIEHRGPPTFPTYEETEILSLRGTPGLLARDAFSAWGRQGHFAAVATPAPVGGAGGSSAYARPVGVGKAVGPLGQFAAPKISEEQRRRNALEAKAWGTPTSLDRADPTASSFESALAAMRGQFGGGAAATAASATAAVGGELQRAQQKMLAESGLELERYGLGTEGIGVGGRETAASQLMSPKDATAKDFKSAQKLKTKLEGTSLGRLATERGTLDRRGSVGRAPGSPRGAGTAGLAQSGGDRAAEIVSASTQSRDDRPGSEAVSDAPIGQRSGGSSYRLSPSQSPASRAIDAAAIAGTAAAPRAVGLAVGANAAVGDMRDASSTAAADAISTPEPRRDSGAPTIHAVDMGHTGVWVSHPRPTRGAAAGTRAAATHSPATVPALSSATSFTLDDRRRVEPSTALGHVSGVPATLVGVAGPTDRGARVSSASHDVTQLGSLALGAAAFESGVQGAGGRTARPSPYSDAAFNLAWSEWQQGRQGPGDRVDLAGRFRSQAIAGVAAAVHRAISGAMGENDGPHKMPTTRKQRRAYDRGLENILRDLSREIRRQRIDQWKKGGKKGPKPSKADADAAALELLDAAKKRAEKEREPPPRPKTVLPTGGGAGPWRAHGTADAHADAAPNAPAVGGGIDTGGGDGTSAECECPCACDDGGRDGDGAPERKKEKKKRKDGDRRGSGGGDVSEDPLKQGGRLQLTDVEKLAAAERELEIWRAERDFIHARKNDIRRQLLKKGIRKSPDELKEWLAEHDIETLLRRQFYVQLALKTALSNLARTRTDPELKHGQKFWELRIAQLGLTDAWLSFGVDAASGSQTLEQAVRLVEFAAALDDYQVDFHTHGDPSAPDADRNREWLSLLSQDPRIEEMLENADPRRLTDSGGGQVVESVARWSPVGWLVGAALDLSHILRGEVEDARDYRRAQGFDGPEALAQIQAARDDLRATRAADFVTGLGAALAAPFDGMSANERAAFVAGVAVITVLTGGLAFGIATTMGGVGGAIAGGAIGGAAAGALEEALRQTIVTDFGRQRDGYNWREMVGVGAIGGIFGAAGGPFSKSLRGVTPGSFRSGVRQYADDLAQTLGMRTSREAGDVHAVRPGVSVQGGSASRAAPVGSASRQRASDWLLFRRDLGGVTEAVGEGAEYTGRLALLNRLGLRRGIQTEVSNLDEAGSWFARVDTAAHEGTHRWIAEHLPSVWRAGDASIGPIPIGAPIKYVEEVIAYNVGHGAALRVHGLGVAPVFEALGSLSARERAFVEALMVTGAALATQDSREPPQ